MQIVYISGWGRSGSTIIGNILNEINGFFHAGELRFIWENGFIHNRLCGCGLPFQKCSIWSKVAKVLLDSETDINPQNVIFIRDEHGIKNSDVVLQSLGLPSSSKGQKRYSDVLKELYHAIFDISGCSVIIDSSKSPSYGFSLYNAGLDVHFIHLIRDPRATAYSWQRKILREDAKQNKRIPMESYTSFSSSKRWMICNVTLERISKIVPQRYTRVRYEDFVANPRKCINSIAHKFEAKNYNSPFNSSHEVHLRENHTVWGNPKRAKTGSISIYNDDEWKSEMEWRDKVTVEAVTWPLLLRYNYFVHSQ